MGLDNDLKELWNSQALGQFKMGQTVDQEHPLSCQGPRVWPCTLSRWSTRQGCSWNKGFGIARTDQELFVQATSPPPWAQNSGILYFKCWIRICSCRVAEAQLVECPSKVLGRCNPTDWHGFKTPAGKNCWQNNKPNRAICERIRVVSARIWRE